MESGSPQDLDVDRATLADGWAFRLHGAEDVQAYPAFVGPGHAEIFGAMLAFRSMQG